MSETNMPAAEVNSYELAFHVLPTVAEGEVTTVFDKLKAAITKHGGTVTVEEAPARFELAYEIVKHLEGRNRKFTSAYFGWVRFTAEPAAIEEIMEEVDGTKELLRHMLTKLTKVEEENPFYFHEALAAAGKKVETVDLDEASEDGEESAEEVDETETEEATEAEDGAESEDKV
ncbi:30S ribosomal protein S6 [Candidatus Kaiserbacteria bacterium]|nr:30S ribosomal protein S6 [Candidatus Kaiserbacteria bacterium]